MSLEADAEADARRYNTRVFLITVAGLLFLFVVIGYLAVQP